MDEVRAEQRGAPDEFPKVPSAGYCPHPNPHHTLTPIRSAGCTGMQAGKAGWQAGRLASWQAGAVPPGLRDAPVAVEAGAVRAQTSCYP